MSARRELFRNALARAGAGVAACPLPPLAAFEEAIHSWAMQHCSYRERSTISVASLYNDYVEWCLQEAVEVPCTLPQFNEWLRLQPFDVNYLGHVYGLVLTIDLVAAGLKDR